MRLKHAPRQVQSNRRDRHVSLLPIRIAGSAPLLLALGGGVHIIKATRLAVEAPVPGVSAGPAGEVRRSHHPRWQHGQGQRLT